MISNWAYHGLVYQLPDARTDRHEKLVSHTSNPLAVHMKGDVYRVFYSGRDAQNRSSVGAVDMDMRRFEVVAEHQNPFAKHGAEGAFDHAGISIGCEFIRNDGRYLTYMAWQTMGLDHWRGDIGLLRLNNDLSIDTKSRQILLEVDPVDPISLSYPWIEKTGGNYEMWYGSTVTWDAGNGEMLHVINHATSINGREWTRHGLAVPFGISLAQAFSRPTVWTAPDETRHMWFSYRDGTGTPYRIGYATSLKGGPWQRHDTHGGPHVGSGSGPYDWDGEMICYPFVFRHEDRLIMLYNGNDFGRHGFGAISQTLPNQ